MIITQNNKEREREREKKKSSLNRIKIYPRLNTYLICFYVNKRQQQE